jgi:hypothetical protein
MTLLQSQIAIVLIGSTGQQYIGLNSIWRPFVRSLTRRFVFVSHSTHYSEVVESRPKFFLLYSSRNPAKKNHEESSFPDGMYGILNQNALIFA